MNMSLRRTVVILLLMKMRRHLPRLRRCNRRNYSQQQSNRKRQFHKNPFCYALHQYDAHVPPPDSNFHTTYSHRY
jgi:hypothetical protein